MTFQRQIITLFSLFISVQLMNAQKNSKIEQTFVITDSVGLNSFASNQKSLTDSIINFGKTYLNTPYRYGSAGDSSFDCSGFTSYVYRNFGYNLSRSSSEQAEQFASVPRSQLKKGDLVFFSGRKRSKRVGHVGIVVGTNGDGNFDFIHASVQSGVIISNSDEAYYQRRFIKANRVVFDNNMLPVNPEINAENEIAENVQPAQKTTIKTIPAEYHKVKSGETLSSISKKFGVSIAELKRQNNLKDSKIKPNQRLKVKQEKTYAVNEILNKIESASPEIVKEPTSAPVAVAEIKTEKSSDEVSMPENHTVQKGESLFSISKRYNISVEDLKSINNLNKSNIRYGQVLKLKRNKDVEVAKDIEPAKVTTPEKVTIADNTQKPEKHKVLAGETLYGISNMYNISIDDLKKANNISGSNIQPGQILNLSAASENSGQKQIASAKITHKVGKGESFFSIARLYGCTVEDLKSWNNKTGNKLNIGERLIIYPKEG